MCYRRPASGGPRMPPSVDDRLEILDLAARYNHAVDSGDHEGVAALFTEDGVIEATATGPIAGRPAIAHYIASRPDGWQRRRHFNSNAIIEGVPGDGDAARLGMSLLVLSRRDSVEPRLYGRCEDDLRRVDGAWRFSRRRIVVDADGASGRRAEE